MSILLQLFLLSCGIIFCLIVLFLLLKYKINERNSVFWLAGAICILLMSSHPNIIDNMAKFLGVDYPPALLFLLSTLVILLFSLYQTIQISKLHTKIKDLSQYLALRDNETMDKNNSQNSNKEEGKNYEL